MEKRKKLKLRGVKNERSPLQNLNGISTLKPYTKKISNLSSSSSSSSTAAVSGKLAPKNCSRFLLSSISCSSSSSPITHFDKKSIFFPKSANNEPNKSRADTSKLRPRSKENEIPRKPYQQKSKRNPPETLTQKPNGENKAKPIQTNAQRSKLSSVDDNRVAKLKKGSEIFGAKMKISQKNDSSERPFELIGVANNVSSNCADNRTPLGKIAANGSGLLSVVEHSKIERANDTSVKTPPVEASLSPEIQNPSHLKVLVLKSAATPVCYGAGHLVSGVTDKRKCRRRGSLRGGPEKVNLFEEENNAMNDLLQDPSIPLLAEASVRWLLSPCKEGREDREGSDCKNKVDECRMVCEIDEMISPPSTLCANFMCSNGSYSGSGGVGNVLNGRRKKFSDDLIGDNSMLSIGSLSSENIIQTPDYDSNTDVCVVISELDSIRETMDMVKLSPTSEISMWDPTSYNGTSRLQNNMMDSVSSWVSDDATLDNLALSRMKISWRDDDELARGMVGKTNDELDCCCLSDKEIDGDGFLENKEDDLGTNNDDLSPMILDYEPHISAKGKEELLGLHNNGRIYAESISTDGGGLLASDDSNWNSYC